MATRKVHVVRIKDPNEDANYVDVKVYDQIAYRGPNGQEMVIDTNAKKAKPRIIDNTGDGNDKSESEPSRISHMERFTSQEDDTQFLDLEILDTIAFSSPNGKRGVLHMPSKDAARSVNDKANLGVSSDDGSPSRKCHTEKITDEKSDVPKEEEKDNFIGTLVTDAVAWKSVNGEQSVLFLPNVNEQDTTEYTQDEDGYNIPPENKDPNLYVKWPQKDDGSTASNGPWLGAQPKSAQTNLAMPPDQGLLWKIINASSNPGPYWQWTPRYQYYAFSSEVFIGWLIAFDWNVFANTLTIGYENDPLLRPSFPRLPRIGSAFNNRDGSLQPIIPPAGYTSLEAQATADPMSLYGAKLDFTNPPQLRFNIPGLGGGWQPNIWQLTGFKQPSHPATEDEADPSKGIAVGDTIYDEPSAGLAKKVVKKYVTAWNKATNDFNSMMEALDGVHSVPVLWINGPTGRAPYAIMSGPAYHWITWDFAIPRVDGPLGGPIPKAGQTIGTEPGVALGNPTYLEQRMDWCAGIHAGAYFGGVEGTANPTKGYYVGPFTPAFAMPVGLDQLDEKKWDTSGDYPVKRPPPPSP